MASPLDPIAKEMKRVHGKRAKTDADHELLAYLEWLGALYTTESGTFQVSGNEVQVDGFGAPCWPGECIEAMLVAAAKKNKLGQQFKAGLICDGNWPLIYDGPKDIGALMHNPDFRDMRMVVISRARVMRTRPIFHRWGLKFAVHYLADVLNESQVLDAVQVAGRLIGLSEYRPKFGRFELE
jgi:hypothetical protein